MGFRNHYSKTEQEQRASAGGGWGDGNWEQISNVIFDSIICSSTASDSDKG